MCVVCASHVGCVLACSPFPGIVTVASNGEARVWVVRGMEAVGYSPGSPLHASVAHLVSRAAVVPPLSLVSLWSMCDPAAPSTPLTHCHPLPDGTLVCGYASGSLIRWPVPFPSHFDTSVRSLYMPDLPTAHTSSTRPLDHLRVHTCALARLCPPPQPLHGLDLLPVLPGTLAAAEAALMPPSGPLSLSGAPAGVCTPTECSELTLTRV
jgi:hypothetical protein